MTEYDKPEPQYVANMVYEYIRNREKIDPWTHTHKGLEINYSQFPIQLEDIITDDTLTFDSKELCYEIDEFKEVDVDGFQVKRRNATGGDYLDFSQILSLGGKIGMKVDEATENQLIFDPESTELQWEISFRVTGGESYRGETPPF